jgi:hypothetical protein
MRPRNPYAFTASVLALLVAGSFASSAALGGPPSVRGCARASGNCSFKKLDGKHFLKMTLTNSRWVKSSLFLASFRFADLYRAKFRGAKLRRADLSRGNRTRADFRNADMSRANVSSADFYGSNLRKANLRGALIVGARFDNANLFFADFTGSYLKSSSFNGARLCHTLQPNGTERNDNCVRPSHGDGGKAPSGGDCCFPGDPNQGKDDGNTNGSGNNDNGNGPIVGKL